MGVLRPVDVRVVRLVGHQRFRTAASAVTAHLVVPVGVRLDADAGRPITRSAR
jgi:hypothetical protein